MKIFRKQSLAALCGFFLFFGLCGRVSASEAELNIGSYGQRQYTASDGVEGTAINTIISASDGFLWIGSHGGLQRYDGREFETFRFSQTPYGVKALLEDSRGRIWIGTTSNAVYCYENEQFSRVDFGRKECADSAVQCIAEAEDGEIYIGTNKGMYGIEPSGKIKWLLDGKNIRSIACGPSDSFFAVTKIGEIFFFRNGEFVNGFENVDSGKAYPRSVYYGEKTGKFYVGSNHHKLWILDENGLLIGETESEELNGINDIREISASEIVLCADSGVGVLHDDEIVYINTLVNSSVEKICRDFQGDFWFASSREGLMELLPTRFVNLSYRLRMPDEIVNSVVKDGEKLYVGMDEGLVLYENERQVENELTDLCKGLRIRAIMKDSRGQIWVATHEMGLYRLDRGGNVQNILLEGEHSGATPIRCLAELDDHTVLAGTEEGILQVAGDRLAAWGNLGQSDLRKRRVLSIVQKENGEIFAGTDGFGLWILTPKGEVKEQVTMQKGLASDFILRLCYDRARNGVWIVTGIGISYVDEYRRVQNIDGFPYPSNKDLMLQEDDTMYIVSGNGFYVTTGETMLADDPPRYERYHRENGLSGEFTSNAWNYMDKDDIYLCGISGLIRIGKKELKKEENALRLRIKHIGADQKELKITDEGVTVPYDAKRLTFEIVPLNYGYQDGMVKFRLKGLDDEELTVRASELTPIDYTNLKGGNYEFQICLVSGEDGRMIDSIAVPVFKQYRFRELPSVRWMAFLLSFLALSMLFLYYQQKKERIMEYRYKKKMEEEKAEFIKRMAYRDLLTEVGNRNILEEDQQGYERFFSEGGALAVYNVGVDSLRYVRKRYGSGEYDVVLKNTAAALKEIFGKNAEIYRMSENIFQIYVKKPERAEEKIRRIREIGRRFPGDDLKKYIISVGVAHSGAVKTYREMLEKAESLRALNEKVNEKDLMSGNTSWLG